MALGGNPQARPLDPRVMIHWVAAPAITAVFLWLALSALAGTVFQGGFFGIAREHYFQAFFVPLALAMAIYLLWTEMRYRNYTYYLGESEITITKGVPRPERTVIRLEEVHNVKVSRSLLEKALGLATVRIETAGNWGGAEGVIPGLGDYDALVDELLDRVENLRGTDAGKQMRKV